MVYPRRLNWTIRFLPVAGGPRYSVCSRPTEIFRECSSSPLPFSSSLFPVSHYERYSIPTCHQKVHTDSGAMTLNSFVQHAIPSPFCLVLTIWQLLHVGPGRKNVHVALLVTSICGLPQSLTLSSRSTPLVP